MTLIFNYMNALSMGTLYLFSGLSFSAWDYSHAMNGVLEHPIYKRPVFYGQGALNMSFEADPDSPAITADAYS